jgi:metal-dependent amidase/aminoacylase/carboxypeptidase family protein
VSREIAPTDAAVVTVGSLQAGTKENVIPDEAIIKLNVRTFDEDVRKRVLAAIERIEMPKPKHREHLLSFA